MIVAPLAQLPEIVVEHSDELKRLLAGLSGPTADLADCMIAWSADEAGCTSTMTFDKEAATDVPGMELLA